MNDAIGALRDYLAAQPEITALVTDPASGTVHVYVNRLPRSVIESADTYHPPKMLVVRMNSGVAKNDLLPTDDPRVTILCYGETDLEADTVRRAVWDKLVYLSRVQQGDVLLHHANPVTGALPMYDPDIVWPGVAQQYELKAGVA